MFRFTFDSLPAEILLLVIDNLSPQALHSLLHCGIHWLPEPLTSQQIANVDGEGNTILHLLAENREADLVKIHY
jgi:hypothetical protein